MVVLAKTWRLPGGLSAFISSVALVRVLSLQVLQRRQSEPKEEVFQYVGHSFSSWGGFGVDEIQGYGLEAEGLDIGEAGYGAGGVVIVRGIGILRVHSIDAFVESCESLGGLKGGHIEEAAPDHGGGEAAGGEARDDAEDVESDYEGAPEVGIG